MTGVMRSRLPLECLRLVEDQRLGADLRTTVDSRDRWQGQLGPFDLPDGNEIGTR